MKVFCPALLSGKFIPARFASKNVPGGQNLSLPISWSEVPPTTKSFVLSVVDHDPGAQRAVHWLVVNISHSARGIPEGASGAFRKLPAGSSELRNRYCNMMYDGPDIHKGSSAREYLVTVYALNVPELLLGPISPPGQFDKEIKGKVIDQATLVAIYQP